MTVNAYGSPWRRPNLPPVGTRVMAVGDKDILVVIKIEPHSVALTDTLTRRERDGHECWHAAYTLRPVTP